MPRNWTGSSVLGSCAGSGQICVISAINGKGLPSDDPIARRPGRPIFLPRLNASVIGLLQPQMLDLIYIP